MNVISWNKLTQTEKNAVLCRPSQQGSKEIIEKTNAIIESVIKDKDLALKFYTKAFDKVSLNELTVSRQEFEEAETLLTLSDKQIINAAIKRIKAYHEAQIPENWVFNSDDGVNCMRQARAISKVGLYVPGGTAPLVSTVLMLAIPALLAGCQLRVLCTPPQSNGKVNPAILYAARTCGVQQVFKVGGAQAIAAMSFGTPTIPKVDKIFGPGNQWVTQAKLLCNQAYAKVSIDLPAGPSELLVIADHSANTNYIAADLLSQAEHDSSSQVLFITTSEQIVKKVIQSVQEQLSTLPRKNIAKKALENSYFIVARDIEQAIEISNEYAPEHLSLQVKAPHNYIPLIQNAGTVFLGSYSAESLGDYITGANHVLPTAGYAKSVSGLSLADFMKWVGFQQVTQSGLQKIGPYAMALAKLEELDAHSNAIQIRLKENEPCLAS